MELRTSGVPGLLDRDLGQELGAAVGQELAREGEPGAVGAGGRGRGSCSTQISGCAGAQHCPYLSIASC